MKLTEISPDKTTKGTYAGVRFSDDTKKAVAEYIKENDIPNPTPNAKLHATLLYSRKHCPDYKAQGDIKPPYVASVDAFDVWEGQPDEDGHKPNCLVLEFKCPELVARHKKLMDEHDAAYDFPEYKSHMTFSYDIGDMKKDKLPKYEGPIELVNEYQEDLDIEWAKSHAKE